MPKATVTAPPGSRVSEKTITTTEKPPITVTSQPVETDDGQDFQPWTKDFWDYIESLKPADWQDHSARVYRYPNGEKKPRELGRYLVRYDVENPLLNEAQLKKEYGGGQYDVLVHRKRKLIFRASFDIEGAMRNPDANAVAAGQVAASGELANTLQVLLQHLQKMQASPAAEQTPKLKETIEMITSLSTAIPRDGVKELVGALSSLQTLTGGAPANRGSDLKETLELLRDLGIVGETKKSRVEEFKEILEVADMLRGGGGSARRGDWATTLAENVPTILEKAGGVLDRVVEVTRNNARVAELRVGAVVQTPGATAAQPTRAQGEIPPAAPARTVAPLETEAAPAAGAAPTITLQPPNMEWVKARAVELFFEGKAGDAVAEWLDNLDPQLGNQLGSLSREQLGQFVAADPILSRIAQAPRFAEFLDEWVDYFTEEPEGAAGAPPAEK